MTALTGTLLPAVASKRVKGKNLNTRPKSKPQRQFSEQTWSQFLGRIANGEGVPQSVKAMRMTPSVLEGYLTTNKKAKGQLDDAKLKSLHRLWSEDMLEEALVSIAMGSTVRQACSKVLMEDNVDSFYRLVMRDPNVKIAYEESRMIQAEKMAIDDIIEIADDAENDETFDGKPNSAAVNRARLKVDSRKWIASKLHYKRFGDRIHQDIDATVVVDHAARLEAARKRKDEMNGKNVKK